MEAMACGCTAFCADNTSLPEVVTDNSYRFNESTATPLANLLEQHLKQAQPFNPSFQREYFSMSKAVSSYIDILNNVCT